MKIPNISDNGNIAVHDTNSTFSQDISNRSYLEANDQDINVNSSVQDNVPFNSNFNRLSKSIVINKIFNVDSISVTQENSLSKIYNRQYRINNQNVVSSILPKENKKQIDPSQIGVSRDEKFLGDVNDSSDSTPAEEEQAFKQSDVDEMSEKSNHLVTRGIVNPNYPGFQHLAHTLQDYSSNIGSSYHSENDMTDDDLDIETPEATLCNDNGNLNEKEGNIVNNNRNHENLINKNLTNVSMLDIDEPNTNSSNEIPDLLKSVSQNNNNIDSINYDLDCSASDIENNFHSKDIIGDFNKEIEDEIRQLLNYNINIEDDLEELRKDIKDSFAKPIENTINNISEVVNHVIKKLVENDGCDKWDKQSKKLTEDHEMAELSDIDKENESNTRTEMNMSRPTFLLIENNRDNQIKDAILSDGKDEINIYEDEYDTEQLTQNVENTIKQLSTELRKIIPKLNEMRERDNLWSNSKEDILPIITDSNCNNIMSGSLSYIEERTYQEQVNIKRKKQENLMPSIKQTSIKAFIEQKDRHKSTKQITIDQNNTSVRQDNIHKELDFESFDVFNIETDLPKLDMDAIESHIKAAKEAERRKRNDREEIRKRLAMGIDNEEYYSLGHIDRPGKKPSLHSRLQNGKNLQICFMNETASDNESQASDLERNVNYNSKSSSQSSLFSKNSLNHPYQTRPLSVNITKNDDNNMDGAKLRPTSLTLKSSSKSRSTHSLTHIELKESDFFALQATLQTEARIALAQAKEMARIQMERERRIRSVSPVTEMLRRSMDKANAPLAADRRRVSRHLLTDMNIAQLQLIKELDEGINYVLTRQQSPRRQTNVLDTATGLNIKVIVNELHSQIESLNDTLVKLLMARDELHMGQDSMLVDIEDLTRYLGVKEQTKKTKGSAKSGVKRLTSLVHK